MRHEPTELSLATDIATKQSHRLSRTHKPAARDLPPVDEWSESVSAIDEAFAQLDAHLAELEQAEATAKAPADAMPATSIGSANPPVDNRPIVANLNAQLNSLDQQCEQLAQLLRTIEADPMCD